MAQEITVFKDTKGVESFLKLRAEEISKVLQKNFEVEKFIRIILNAVNSKPELLECEPNSFWLAVMTCAEVNLIPNSALQHCFLIPYNEKQKDGKYIKKAQFQFGYKGIVQLARNSGELVSAEAHPVYEGDNFDYAYGTASFLKHKPEHKTKHTKETLSHVWAMIYFSNKDIPPQFDVFDKAKIEKYRQASKMKDGSTWTYWYEEMAAKTVLKHLLKYAPMSVEFKEKLEKETEFDYDRIAEIIEQKQPEKIERPDLLNGHEEVFQEESKVEEEVKELFGA